jgi:hypothetical protein
LTQQAEHRVRVALSSFCRQRNWVRFEKNVAGQFLSLLLWRLSKTHTWSATVLVEELDPGGVE